MSIFEEYIAFNMEYGVIRKKETILYLSLSRFLTLPGNGVT